MVPQVTNPQIGQLRQIPRPVPVTVEPRRPQDLTAGVPEALRGAVRKTETTSRPERRTTEMLFNEVRQQARRSAAERVVGLRQHRADPVKKQEGLSAEVMIALVERDALIVDAERRAGTALKALVSSGLSPAEATVWCDLDGKDAARLLRLRPRRPPRREGRERPVPHGGPDIPTPSEALADLQRPLATPGRLRSATVPTQPSPGSGGRPCTHAQRGRSPVDRCPAFTQLTTCRGDGNRGRVYGRRTTGGRE